MTSSFFFKFALVLAILNQFQCKVDDLQMLKSKNPDILLQAKLPRTKSHTRG